MCERDASISVHCTYFLRRCRCCGNIKFRILLIQRCSNLLVCMHASSEQLRREKNYAYENEWRKKAADNRKSKFASINCANMVAKIGVLLLVNTSMATAAADFLSFLHFYFYFLTVIFNSPALNLMWSPFFSRCCCCGFLNSRTPHIYMLMMVCWLTKLRHTKKWPIVGKKEKRRGQEKDNIQRYVDLARKQMYRRFNWAPREHGIYFEITLSGFQTHSNIFHANFLQINQISYFLQMKIKGFRFSDLKRGRNSEKVAFGQESLQSLHELASLYIVANEMQLIWFASKFGSLSLIECTGLTSALLFIWI